MALGVLDARRGQVRSLLCNVVVVVGGYVMSQQLIAGYRISL